MQINTKLLERLEKVLQIGRRQLNARITNLANSQRVERVTAALLLAADNGIPIDRYSTAAERAAMRGASTSPQIAVQSQSANVTARVRAKRPTKLKAKKSEDNLVFVVHGRDNELTKSMFDFLRSIGLRPLEWEKAILLAKDNNPHIQQILDEAMAQVQAVVVIFSPDDDAMLTPSLRGRREPRSETILQGQPRSNVLFEAGLAMGRHADKTMIVQVGTLRGFSDIFGRHVTRLTNAQDKRNDVINRLEKIGCKVDRRGVHWMTTGDFTPKRKAKHP
jgi:predicted nucleotide-binding protein